MPLMHDLKDSFGIRFRRREKVRDVRRMTAADGRLLCWKPYSFEEPEVKFIARALRHLEDSGYERSPRLFTSKEGLDYVSRNGEYGMLSNWVAGRRPEFRVPGEWRKGLRELARFHKAAEGLSDQDVPDSRIRYDKLGRLTADYRKELAARPGLRRFEELCDLAAGHLKKDLPKRALEDERKAGSFVHGDYNFPNLILDSRRRLHLIDLENTSMQARVTDLAHLLYRNKPFDADGVLSSLEVYERTRPLSPADRHLLHALLHIPYPIVRQLRQFGDRFKQKGELPSSKTTDRFTRGLRRLVE